MRRLTFLLSALLLPLAPPANAATPPTVTITTQSRFYAPNPIRLRAGEPVTLRLVNADASTHAFAARRFFRSAEILSGDVNTGRVQLAPGESRSVTLVPAKGSYKVECSHRQMDKLRMQGQIVVE